MAATTALPATAGSCLLQPSLCRFTGAAPTPSLRLTAASRRDGGSGVAWSCYPGPPPPAVRAERKSGGAGVQATSPERTVRIVAVVGEGSVSPIKDTPWEEVMRHTVLNCLFDPSCRKALQCLNSCSPTDQVCNYRCIASYESPHLEAFSLCVLQKHNCLDLNAEVPSKPSVKPLTMFRDQKLSHEVAEDLFVGWLDSMEWSWRVAAGQNPAYDQFPCQYQLFYRGKAKGSFWYEPVFQVKTLEGKLVWRRRRYRVRRASSPGTFYFSVLDNGVVSKEFWTIVDVPDDFSWGLFHYHGAAQAAGLAYTGAVLVTPDGSYPDVENARLASALEKCGIKKWELYMVDNCSCLGAPLGTPEGSKLHYQIAPGKETAILQKR